MILRRFCPVFVLVLGLLIPCFSAWAQSTATPLPVAVVKDADGKVMGQVAGFSSNFWPVVILDFNGSPAYLMFRPYGLIDRIASNQNNAGGPTVYFDGLGCTGTAYLNEVAAGALEISGAGTYYGVAGPDPTTGEYTVYGLTTTALTGVATKSRWQGGECIDIAANLNLPLAVEITPNPLAGFHGPTLAEPTRVLTIEGGDRATQ